MIETILFESKTKTDIEVLEYISIKLLILLLNVSFKSFCNMYAAYYGTVSEVKYFKKINRKVFFFFSC